MKSREEIMEILEAFDLTGSLRDAGELAGCSHHTVAAYVARRDAGRLPGDGPFLLLCRIPPRRRLGHHIDTHNSHPLSKVESLGNPLFVVAEDYASGVGAGGCSVVGVGVDV